MSNDQWIIVDGPTWRLGRSSGEGLEFYDVDEGGERSLGQRIAQQLYQNGYRGENVAMGLSARRCLTETIETVESEIVRDRQTRIYCLEERLPLTAEEMAVDFVDSKESILGVAVQTAELRQLLDDLEANGVAVQTITPWPLLACRAFLSGEVAWDMIYWQSAQTTNAFRLDSDTLVEWTLVEWDLDAWSRHLRLCSADGGAVRVLLLPQGDEAVLDFTSGSCEFEVRHGILLDAWAARGARDIISGQSLPWIDLRRDGLANSQPYRSLQGLMRIAAITTTLMLLLLAGVIQIRARYYDRLAEKNAARQTDLFRQILPDQKVPPGIESRLQSELAKLRAEREIDSVGSDVTSVIRPLYEFLRGLPTDLKFKLTQLRFSKNRIDLSGEVLSLRDATVIANGLAMSGFEVTSPKAVRTEDGFSFVLAAKWKAAADRQESAI